MTQSGAYDKKIAIGKTKMVTDNQGFQHREFQAEFRPWSKVTPMTEDIGTNTDLEQVAKERVTFEIYYREGISKNSQIMFRGKVYNVKSIFNPGFNNVTLVLSGERDDSLIVETTTTTTTTTVGA